jgi:hypothetical protein
MHDQSLQPIPDLQTRRMKRMKKYVLLALLFCSLLLSIDGKAPYPNLSQGAQQTAMVTSGSKQAPAASSYRQAPAFALEDQHGRTHSYQFPRYKVSLLAFGDRQGSEQIESWIRPLYRRYEKRIDIHGVADVSAVPSWLRGMVRRAFRSKLDYPVMLDWSGRVSKDYAYRGGEANLFLIDRQGRIVLVKSGAANAADLAQIYRTLDEMLQQG